MTFLERACSSGDFMEGVVKAVAFEIHELVEEKTVVIGGAIEAVSAIAGTPGLLALEEALAFLLLKLFELLDGLAARDNARLGETVDDLRAVLLNQDDPARKAAGIFIWQCIYHKLFTELQGPHDYEAISYAVMDQHNYRDLSCNVNVESIEVFFEASDPKLIPFIDALIAFEAAQEFRGKSFGGYAALRFTGPSRALLAMQRWPVTCSVELAGLKDVEGTTELVDYAVSLALNCSAGVFHWGQANPSTAQDIEDRFGSTALVRAGELQKWRQALSLITEGGHFKGFSSPFTRQTGLEI